MRVGLRPIHSVAMITWVSERSGSASSWLRCALHTPQPASAAARVKTSSRLRADRSISRAIGPGFSVDMAATRRARRAEPALGVEQELRPGGDAIARGEAG